MAAAVAETTFAYHGLPTSPQMAQTDQVKFLIRTFLEGIQFDRTTPFLKDHELEQAVWKYFQGQSLDNKSMTAVRKTLKLSVTLTHQAYTAHPFEIKVLCAAQFLYMFLVDDIAEEFMVELQSFGQNFTLNKPHNHPLLDAFDGHLRNLANYYGPYCYAAIIKTLFDYVNGRIIEHKMEQSNFTFHSESRLMPMFLRTKVGGAEILLHLLFPQSVFPEDEYLMRYFPVIQELVLFTDFTNDILSYYKEFILHGEKGNFVGNFADTHRMQQLDVLQHLTGYTPKLLKSVYSILDGNEDLLRAVKNFVTGWIMLCTAHRRYYLVELFEDEQYLPPYDEDA
ncbi:uncharacterized protein ASPGLDRAFT_27185 [Aspergillus glaucus CBS 516.65]|uniref:Trichodiene synthase n=1 Tax=Aspergillus glaucus CBS 516.65 TaxID=1160497 RepID=A0A1L9VEJ5_ASPGL|nr:hypothetical protein ASPGLDRAFT_27185 [Aspergillus glaucus CBS 516.65]OJJ82330.1 hypothetical protein ASPGLDRAFT_27185 [Aspergillus glaucus CBS 516.65]